MTGIYKIASPTGRIYIGQSKNLDKRKKDYTPGRCKHQRKVNASIKKYGIKNHIFEICYVLPNDVSQDVLDNYEIFYFEQFKEAGFRMMNIKECGNGGGKHSEETKLIIGKISKDRFLPKEGFKIHQFDYNLNLIKIWECSINDIEISLNLGSSISRVCKANGRGEFKMSDNSFFLFEKDISKIKEIDVLKIIKARNQHGEFLKYI